jgi:ferritin
MIKDNVAKLLCEQVTAEYYSAYLYQAMSAWADNAGWKGISRWLFLQAEEEVEHGTRSYKHLLERGAFPTFGDIKAPPTSYTGVTELFEKVVNHERSVTELINNIADLSLSEKDHATYSFIMWFVKEQIEEEATAEEILWKLKLGDNNLAFLFSMDTQLGMRQSA